MITVVSGLPRSGTSLMMQMLQAGGMTVLTDQVRPADEDNPRGYFELEGVKGLKDDSAWLAEAEGKVIKVISMLLEDLPPTHDYQVLFMTRDLDEILASQEVMLARRRGTRPDKDAAGLRGHFATHLAKVLRFLEAADRMRYCCCDYNRLIADPAGGVDRILAFLGTELDRDRILSVIDPRLYRRRVP